MSGDRFFGRLRAHLDREGGTTLRELIEETGAERIYGLGILMLAATAFIPGVTNVLALGIVGLGVQMALGRARPWIPGRILDHRIQRGGIRKVLGRLARAVERLGPRSAPRPLPERTMGLLVTWTALLLALPLPLPLANLLPGMALMLMGVALLEDWPLSAWAGAFLSAGTTVYFALSFDLVLKALKAVWHLRHLTD